MVKEAEPSFQAAAPARGVKRVEERSAAFPRFASPGRDGVLAAALREVPIPAWLAG